MFLLVKCTQFMNPLVMWPFRPTILTNLNDLSSCIDDVIPCSLMYGAEDPSIAGMVLDSPFSDLVDLMMELVDTYKIRLPKFTVSILNYFFG